MLDEPSPTDELTTAKQRPSKPKRSASLILIDRQGSTPRLLLGRRDSSQKFMPDKYVFPGGKTDRHDHRMTVVADLQDSDRQRLMSALGSRASHAKARSIALSAIRETQEETGLLLGAHHSVPISAVGWSAFTTNSLAPDLSLFRLIARAVTPPIYRHRYDTHFFATFRDQSLHEAHSRLTPSDELLDPNWFTFLQAKKLDLPEITRTILHDIETRLMSDPDLSGDSLIPYYAMSRGKMLRKLV